MKPAGLELAKRTVAVIAGQVALAGERLGAAIKAIEAGELADSASELRAAATLPGKLQPLLRRLRRRSRPTPVVCALEPRRSW